MPEQPQTDDGLVAHWPLDDAVGVTASEVTGRYAATLTNGAAWTALGKFAGAVQLHGFGAYLTPPTIDVFGDALTLAAWVKIAQYPSVGDQRIISKSTGTAEQAHYWMLSHAKKDGRNLLQFRLKTGSTTSTLTAISGDLPVDTWFHAAATYDGTTMRVYLNGVEVARASKSGTIATNAGGPINIGRNPDGTNYLQGIVDDVRIYERALSSPDIATVMNNAGHSAPDIQAPTVPSGVQATPLSSTQMHVHWSPSTDNRGVAGYRVRRNGVAVSTNVTSYVESGLAPSTTYSYTVSAVDAAGNESSQSPLASAITPAVALESAGLTAVATASSWIPVAHWRLDEGSGMTAADSVGTRAATLTGSATWVTGQSSYAVKLNGTSGYLASPPIDVGGSQLTVAAWVNHTAPPGSAEQQIISKTTATSDPRYYWTLGTTRVDGQTRLRFRLRAGSETSSLTASRGTIPAGTWYHAAATYDGSMMRIYLNGVEVASRQKTGVLATNSAAPMNMGRSPSGYGYLNGSVDDARIYDRTLGGADIAAIVNADSINDPPQVALTAPGTGATFTAPATIALTASASDPENRMLEVQFFSGTTLLATDATAPYSLSWSSVPAGSYSITAVARDADGAFSSSAAVAIRVTAAANQAPSVSIVSPAAGATVAALGTVTITASASDPENRLTDVQFYTGMTLLGTDTTAPYSFTWSSVPAGAHGLRAVARDADGGSTISPVVWLTTSTALQVAPWYVAFTASIDHHTTLTSYLLEIYPAGSDPNVAVAFKSSDLGKPTPSSTGQIKVERTALFEGLPPGPYVLTVRAVGSDGSSRSATYTFTR